MRFEADPKLLDSSAARVFYFFSTFRKVCNPINELDHSGHHGADVVQPAVSPPPNGAVDSLSWAFSWL